MVGPLKKNFFAASPTCHDADSSTLPIVRSILLRDILLCLQTINLVSSVAHPGGDHTDPNPT